MGKQTKAKRATQAQAQDLTAERAQRGQKTPPGAAEQMGATDQEVLPLTPPMAESDQLPGRPNRKKNGADDQIDPADELTPG
jgi:hypothetical protein